MGGGAVDEVEEAQQPDILGSGEEEFRYPDVLSGFGVDCDGHVEGYYTGV